MKKALRRAHAVISLSRAVFAVGMISTPGWFGHIRGAFRFIHTDDHGDLARQAVDFLLREELVSVDSGLVEMRDTVESSCGMLDLIEGESLGRVPGRLRWEYSHFYDPIARRGLNDGKYLNAFVEFRDFWEQARIHHRAGSFMKAHTFLGYSCHLLQDMAVPSHTHCVVHGLRSRTSDNLELLSRKRRYYLRIPAGPPYRGDEDAHLALFCAMAYESRGREAFDHDEENEIADILARYYESPCECRAGWVGRYVGDGYYPYHRLLPSSARIRWVDLVSLRNFLMERAASRTAQLLLHFSDVTGAGD